MCGEVPHLGTSVAPRTFGGLPARSRDLLAFILGLALARLSPRVRLNSS